MTKCVLSTLFTCCVAVLLAQPAAPKVHIGSGDEPLAVDFAKTITAEELKEHITILASDEYEGRETGTPGQKKAAQYIADYFQSLGLPKVGNDDSYFQKIVFTSERWEKTALTVNGEEYKQLLDFYALPTTNSDQPSLQLNEVVFLGYGIDDAKYSDYKNENVSGKAILIYSGEPLKDDGTSLLTGTSTLSDWSTDFRKKLKVAKQKGVKTVFIIDGDLKKNIAENRRVLLGSGLRLGDGERPTENYANNVFISTTIAKSILGDNYKKVIKARNKIQTKGKPKSVVLNTDIQLTLDKDVRQLLGENVLGFIEGTDAALKNEIVVLSAHYDHLGKRGDDIFHGADDNGSGTATVLEIAQALLEAKKKGVGPRRSVLVLLVSGEEKGLLGSEYYASYPVFPLENTIANVNVDMVGRVDEKHKNNPEYIYVIGSNRLSTELHDINETANSTYTNLELDYTYNAEDDPNRYYYRSDHYNFAEKGIPAIFYFSGTHEDYHRTTDTVDKIMFDKIVKIGQLVFYTTWELANRDERIKVDVKP